MRFEGKTETTFQITLNRKEMWALRVLCFFPAASVADTYKDFGIAIHDAAAALLDAPVDAIPVLGADLSE